jgi:hypothetical protein
VSARLEEVGAQRTSIRDKEGKDRAQSQLDEAQARLDDAHDQLEKARVELDEGWDEGSHYGGGTIHVDVEKGWFELPYDEFLQNVLKLAAATHYGFTLEDLKEKEGLKEFFGF